LPVLNKKTSAYETSIFCISDIRDDEIWAIGEKEVAKPRSLRIHGRGDFLAQTINELGLTIDPDNTPPRHAKIIGWSNEKSKQKLRAQEIAATKTTKFVVSPPKTLSS